MLHILGVSSSPGYNKPDFPNKKVLEQVKNVQMRDLIKKMLDRDPTKRITIKKIGEVL